MSTYSNCNNSLSVGDIIKFGNYFINDDTTKEPIEWRVLEVSNDKALLITKDAIDCKPYNYEMRNITWENCTLRQWLNNEFINQAFSKEVSKTREFVQFLPSHFVLVNSVSAI